MTGEHHAPDPATAEFPAVERRGRGQLYRPDRHPRQRKSDGGWRYRLGWLYRQVIPAVAIIVAAVAVNSASDASSKAEHNARVARTLAAGNRRAVVSIQQGRRAAVQEACTQDEAMAEAVRKALLGFGVGRTRPAPSGVAQAFEPLGGLKPLTAKQKRARCNARVRRGAGP